MFSEKKFKLNGSCFKYITMSNMFFPLNLHSDFEMHFVDRGRLSITIDDIDYLLESGSAAVIFPRQKHTFFIDKESFVTIFRIPAQFIRQFAIDTRGRHPVCPVFSYKITVPDLTNIYQIKAMLYDICGDIFAQIKFKSFEYKPDTQNPIDKILFYIDEHYTEPCPLKKVSEIMKYDYTYLSKQFKNKMGMTYSDYINNFRINMACYALSSKNHTVTEIAHMSGFGSLQTFNREFKQVLGMTPSEYRENQKALETT